MTSKVKWLLVGVIGLVVFLSFRSCKKPAPTLLGPLPSDAQAQVGIQHNVITILSRKGNETKYVPNDGSAVVTLKNTGEIVLAVKNKGFTFHPVVGPYVGNRLDLAVGGQFGYWNRYELYAGIKGPRWAVFAATGYRLDQLHLDNTSLYVAYATDKTVGVGVFVRF